MGSGGTDRWTGKFKSCGYKKSQPRKNKNASIHVPMTARALSANVPHLEISGKARRQHRFPQRSHTLVQLHRTAVASLAYILSFSFIHNDFTSFRRRYGSYSLSFPELSPDHSSVGRNNHCSVMLRRPSRHQHHQTRALQHMTTGHVNIYVSRL
jgi:hypothetical protein